jgi:branched-chain amino acid transport system substrate-binding protein
MKKYTWAALSFVVVGCTKPAAPKEAAPVVAADIVVGEIGSLTGSEATFGSSTRDGIDLAVGGFNNAGGLNGRKLRLVIVDDQGKAEEAATAATKLINQDKVLAILGEVASSRTLAAAPIAQTAKIPLITPSSTDAKVTQVGDDIFRVCFVDSFQGTVMAIFAVENLKAAKAAVLRDGKSDYSVGLAKEFEDNFKRLTGEIVAEETYQAGEVDFKAQLTKIKATKPDVLFVPGYYTEVGLIARQAKELGVKAVLLGGDGWDSPKLKEIGGDAVEGSYFSNHYSGQAQTPEVQGFIRSFKAAYGHEPDGFAAMGYDAMYVMIDALKRAKAVDSASLRDALAQTKNVAGVTGRISIDANRNAAKSAVVLKVDKGAFNYQTTVNPYPFPN